MKYKEYLINRLSEPSTWRGAIMLLTALGINLTPDQGDSIVAFGVALTGLIGVFSPDGIKK